MGTSAIKTCLQPVFKGEEGGLNIELYFPSVGVISQKIWLGLQLSFRKKYQVDDPLTSDFVLIR